MRTPSTATVTTQRLIPAAGGEGGPACASLFDLGAGDAGIAGDIFARRPAQRLGRGRPLPPSSTIPHALESTHADAHRPAVPVPTGGRHTATRCSGVAEHAGRFRCRPARTAAYHCDHGGCRAASGQPSAGRGAPAVDAEHKATAPPTSFRREEGSPRRGCRSRRLPRHSSGHAACRTDRSGHTIAPRRNPHDAPVPFRRCRG